ncbi:MAG: DUF4403 family protein [Gemmatimonadales bacterium]|nr:MAG: DUF4403 family protein [Gemmatimonadales bacterium]
MARAGGLDRRRRGDGGPPPLRPPGGLDRRPGPPPLRPPRDGGASRAGGRRMTAPGTARPEGAGGGAEATPGRRSRRTALLVVGGLGLAAVAILVVSLFRDEADPPRVDPPAPEVVDADPAVEELPVSLLAAPIHYDLAHVIAELEDAIPFTLGDLDERENHGDNDRVTVAWEATRDSLTAEVRGDTAVVATEVSYGIRAWYDPPVLPAVSASCGLDEDPSDRPRARIQLRSRLVLDPDWTLRSEATPDTVRAVSEEDRDLCRITPLRIDVTGTVLDGVASALEDRLPEVDRRVAEVDLASRLQDVWDRIGEPVELTDDVWLQIRPEAVVHGGTRGEGTTLRLDVGMRARPRIVLGPRPEHEPSSLPSLETGSVPDTARIHMEGHLHHQETSRLLGRELEGESLELGGNLLRIRDVEVLGIGAGRIALEISFEGAARGRIYLVGRPELDREARVIRVPDLDFDLQTRNVLAGGLAWIARDELVRLLREQAVIPLGEVTDLLREQFRRGLDRELADGVAVRGEPGDIELESIVALRDRILLRASAGARARLEVSLDR